jgi:hypothetical protein
MEIFFFFWGVSRMDKIDKHTHWTEVLLEKPNRAVNKARA